MSRASRVQQVTDGQSYPLFVGEPKSLSFELLFENTVLFDEIVDDRLLVVVKPADQGNNEEVEGLYDVCHYKIDCP